MLSAILADDYLGIDSLGRITNKEEELKRIRPPSGIRSRRSISMRSRCGAMAKQLSLPVARR